MVWDFKSHTHRHTFIHTQTQTDTKTQPDSQTQSHTHTHSHTLTHTHIDGQTKIRNNRDFNRRINPSNEPIDFIQFP